MISCGVNISMKPLQHFFHMLLFTSYVPYYGKLTLHEIKVLEINANLMENDFRIKKINAKEEVEFHNKGN